MASMELTWNSNSPDHVSALLMVQVKDVKKAGEQIDKPSEAGIK
jgi:hypothetical protein